MVLYAAAAGLLHGCATMPPPETAAPAAVLVLPAEETVEITVYTPAPVKEEPAVSPEALADARAAELVVYLAAVARASATVQKKELASCTTAFGRAPTPHARLKLGGLYAQPSPILRDDARAQALLEPLAMANVAPADRAIADLASLLYAQVAERLRLLKEAKDDAKKHEDLREQLDAMRSIERSIMQREERQRTR